MVNINKDMVEESVWLEAYIAYISSSNSTSKDNAANWADKCLSDYKERFNDRTTATICNGLNPTLKRQIVANVVCHYNK